MTARLLVEGKDREMIDDAYPKTSSARVEFLKGALKWTITCGRKELGDAELQTRLAECLWEMKEKTAAYHFALRNSDIQGTVT
jgi:hypothetical protein